MADKDLGSVRFLRQRARAIPQAVQPSSTSHQPPTSIFHHTKSQFTDSTNMLVLIFSVIFTLTVLIATTATPHDRGSTSEQPASAAVFGAVGTIIGYFGIEIGSDSLFERLLWPTRFYNTLNPSALFQLTMLTPMGGPLLRPAVRVIDKFIAARMHWGKRQGDPLGTAFYSNLRRRYIKHLGKGSKESRAQQTEEFRNFICVRVLRLVHAVDGQKGSADFETAEHTKPVSARRPVYLLDLTPIEHDAKTTRDTDTVFEVSNDVGTLRIRNVVGIFCSELIASCTGCCVAIIFKSAYAILFFLPLVLKLISLVFCVRRQHLVWSKPPTTKAAKEIQFKDDVQMLTQMISCSSEDRNFYSTNSPTTTAILFVTEKASSPAIVPTKLSPWSLFSHLPWFSLSVYSPVSGPMKTYNGSGLATRLTLPSPCIPSVSGVGS